MKKFLSIKFFLSYTLCLTTYLFTYAQAGEWTWVKGDSTNYAGGNFGTQGIPSPNNNPPGFYEPSEWKDKQGNFWFYGGYHGGVNNDVWRYNVQTNEWTWMNGNGNGLTPPHYG